MAIGSTINESRDKTMQEGWMTQEEIANKLNVPIDRVRNVVPGLAKAGVIQTMRNPLDNRYVLVHESGIEIIRKAIFG
jgi:DNA-binding MarR family transcriptional regulator